MADLDAVAAALKSGRTTTIGGREYAALVTAGCACLAANKAELNKINVFPIPDGDTGTNMAMACRGIVKGVRKATSDTLGDVAAAAAEACVLSAQGNSGTILTFFFGAIAKRTHGVERLDAKGYRALAREVGADMKNSVRGCVEGTMPTVILESTKDLKASSLQELFASWADNAKRATDDTPNRLKVDGKLILKKRGVVDSGAKGFMYFAKGCADLFSETSASTAVESQSQMKLSDVDQSASGHEGADDVALGRYCTEFVCDLKRGVTGDDLADRVKDLGTSIVPLVVEGPRGRTLGKVHIHAHEPEEVFERARSLSSTGELLKEKAEDMVAQVEAQKSRYLDSVLSLDPARSTCSFLVSANFDLPTELLARVRAQWAGRLWLIPSLTIVNEEAYEDKVELESQEISDWCRLDPDLRVSSSAARVRTFDKALREALDATEGEVVVMLMCVNLSLGTRSAFDAASAKLTVAERARVYPYDSDLIAGPQAMVMLEMLRLAAMGGDAVEVLARADALKPGIGHVAGAPTLTYAIRGGRIKLPPPVLKFVLRFAIRFQHHQRPRDKPRPYGKTMGGEKALPKVRQKVQDLVVREVPTNASVGFVVQHTGRADDVREFVDFLRDRYPDARYILCCYVGTTTFIHQGPGAYGVSWMRFDAPQFFGKLGPRVAPALGQRGNRARGFRGREDLPTAADARELFRAKAREVFCLEEGRCFARVHGEKSDKTPVVICSGNTGAALMYDGLAEQMAATYGSRVIWDRYFQGLSDRLKDPKRNGPELWTAQLDQLIERLGMPRIHLLGVSHGSFVAAHYAARHPDKVERIAFVSPVLGGFSHKARRKVAAARRYPGCVVNTVGKRKALRKVPTVLKRCEAQVDDGASAVGLEACELGYRTRGTALGLLWSFRGEPMASYQRSGAPDLCEAIASCRIPVWARTYSGDEDVDEAGWDRAWALLAAGHRGSVRDRGAGGHHAFYSDDAVPRICTFFGKGEKKRRKSERQARAEVEEAVPQRPEEPAPEERRYECEHLCGFTGSFRACADHELTCAKNPANVTPAVSPPADAPRTPSPGRPAPSAYADAADVYGGLPPRTPSAYADAADVYGGLPPRTPAGGAPRARPNPFWTRRAGYAQEYSGVYDKRAAVFPRRPHDDNRFPTPYAKYYHAPDQRQGLLTSPAAAVYEPLQGPSASSAISPPRDPRGRSISASVRRATPFDRNPLGASRRLYY